LIYHKLSFIMDMKALAAAAARKAQKSGVAPPPPPQAKKKQAPVVPQQNAASRNAAKNAAAAAIAAKMGGGSRGPPPPQAAPPAPRQPAAGGGGGGAALSPADEAIATQYRKMVKLGLPDGAIRHKMNGDGVPPHIQDAVLSGAAGPAPAAATSSSRAPPPQAAPVRQAPAEPTVQLSPSDELIAQQYRTFSLIFTSMHLSKCFLGVD
jgi:hypothetical protein